MDFSVSVGLPVCFADLGYLEVDRAEVRLAADKACISDSTTHNMPFEVTAEMVYQGLMMADAYGRAFRVENHVKLEQDGPDRVKVTGATGYQRPETLKVSVGYKDGFIGSAGLSYGGHKCFERAVLAVETLEHIIRRDYETEELKIDIIGYNSLFPRDYSQGYPGDIEPLELRVRVAAHTRDRETLELIANEVDALTIGGPANCGGLSRSIKELVAVLSVLIPREDICFSYIEKEV